MNENGVIPGYMNINKNNQTTGFDWFDQYIITAMASLNYGYDIVVTLDPIPLISPRRCNEQVERVITG